VRLAENGWNSRDPEKVALAYTLDSRWRNRAEFIKGRAAIRGNRGRCQLRVALVTARLLMRSPGLPSEQLVCVSFLRGGAFGKARTDRLRWR
jgi:hypothetical protein